MDEVTLPSGYRVPMPTRHADVQALLVCPHASRKLGKDDPPLVEGGGIDAIPDVVINTDGNQHRRLRSIAQSGFSVRQAERWRPLAGRLATELASNLPSRWDVSSQFAGPLSSQVICHVLGVPTRDRDQFVSWISTLFSASPDGADARFQAVQDFTSYTAQLVADHRVQPRDDLIDQLIQARDADDRLTSDELVTMIFALIVAGHETLVTMITRGVFRLLLTDSYRLLVEDPTLVEPAVEEVLRYDGPGAYGMLRVLTGDVTLSGGQLAAGTVVLPNLMGANHDPDAFPDPDTFDIERFRRPGTAPHVAFGFGPHFCLGAHLARVEMQEAFSAVTRHFPRLRMAVAPEEVVWSGDINHRPQELPVEAS
ncbi:cytochrome P450 [Nonomuraea sp. NPDC050536]|uniref:cytochrome P450 n=1 Tax=Nonomuraea sp. NPDC050536 TaxID=3364366 RepID=UPI0037CAAFB7